MSLETVTEDLEYYKPLLKKYRKLYMHMYSKTHFDNFEKSATRWKSQKDFGITNFITFLVIEFVRGKKYIDLYNEEQRAEIEFYTTRRLQ